ncbi:uncharacterized protein LOC119727009 [Patiria miniata]|uniref:Apple domain-containing protein n=1 Tax=Patiria miniata TaxID=46514 RepID=A0A913ZST6_PATMI|nr:uncharacterized protein LOC119727009 [Patiria miniata]
MNFDVFRLELRFFIFNLALVVTLVSCSSNSTSYQSALFETGSGHDVEHRPISSARFASRTRCAAHCLTEKHCRFYSYDKGTLECVLRDASVVSPTQPSVGYLTRRVCTSTYKTQGQFKYLYPLPPFSGQAVLDFSVQTIADAIVSLSTNGTFKGVKYELVIGANGNTNTYLRLGWKYTPFVNRRTVGVVSEHEMRRFWLRYDHGTFALGKHERAAYLEWTDPTPPANPPRFIGFGSWVRHADWVVHGNCPA